MIEIKDLFTKSLFAGICLGFGIVSAGLIGNPVLQGFIISLGFIGAMELGYPLITERWGDARLMTTFNGYITPDAFIFRLIVRRMIPGNILGILIVTLLGILLLPEETRLVYEVACKDSWWKLLLSSMITGLLLDISSKLYYKQSIRWFIVVVTAFTFALGLDHSLVNIGKITYGIIYGNLDILTAVKILLISTAGNFIGSRIRTIIIKDNE